MTSTKGIIHADHGLPCRNRTAADWLYMLALAAGALFSMQRYSGYMDYYEQAILVGSALTWGWLGGLLVTPSYSLA